MHPGTDEAEVVRLIWIDWDVEMLIPVMPVTV
jgi:hypothetical protein